MKHLKIIAVISALILCLTACGKAAEPDESSKASTTEAYSDETDTTSEVLTSETETITEASTEPMVIPDAYKPIISIYTRAISEDWDLEACLDRDVNFLVAKLREKAAESIGYYICDFDGDGNEELVIGTTDKVENETYKKQILSLYTISDGKASLQFGYIGSNSLYWLGGNDFLFTGTTDWDPNELSVMHVSGSALDVSESQDTDRAYAQLEYLPFV